jgi:hypothetical protein
MTEESLFHEALAKPADERSAFLGAACAGLPELRAAVEALLAAHESSDSLLDRPLATGEYTPDPAASPAGATTAPQPSVGVGAVIAGRYTLVERIGEGGMGEVWVAKQTEPIKRKVALKVIKAGMDSKAVVARFEQERQALALMDHPNIARVLDGGLTAEGRPFFVMELVNGLPLTRFCDEARLTPRQRLELFVPICQAVQHAHHKGIVHRDLKPANILVTLIDGRPIPKVIDFGVAKATAGKLTDESLSTQFGAVVGTLEYMSPEQAGFAGEDIDTRADIYSLGVILYELLTGLRPIDRKRLKQAALTEAVRILREEEPAKPSTRLSTEEALPSLAALRQTEPKKLMALLRGELDWVVMKCLEKQRDRRYETANGLARDIQRYLADEAVEARPASARYRLGKFLRRHKGSVAAAVALLVALLLGMGGTTWGLLRAEQRRAEADTARADEARERALAQEKEQEAQREKENAVKAAAAESAALEQTRRRLAQIEKGVELLASLLTGLNPRNEEKGDPPLYEQLRQRASKAADQLDGEAVGDAQAVARLQAILGNTLHDLGDYPKAIAVLDKAYATTTREQGDDHPETLTSRNNLASAYHAAGQLDRAIPLFERTLKAREVQLGDDHPDTLTSRNNLAAAYQSAGKRELALLLFEGTLKAREAKLGDDHPDTLDSRNNLANAYLDAGQLDLAIPLFERILKVREAQLGDNHPVTLLARNNLATAYKSAGKPDRAIALLESTLKALEAKLGDDHPYTLTARNNLALAYQAAGKLESAIPLLERTLKARETKQGVDHPNTLLSRNNLAQAYHLVGKRELALPLFEQAAVAVEKLRFQHEHAGGIIANTIAAYEAAKQLDKAESWCRKWLAAVRPPAGESSPVYATGLAVLGHNLLAQQKWSEAEAPLRECLALRKKGQPEAWTTFNTESFLGGSLLGQRKYTEAEPLLLSGYTGMKERQKTIPPRGKVRLPEAAERLMQLYEATGKKDEAARWRKEVETLRAAAKAAEKPETKP